MNIETMQDIWNNKPVGYLRANYFSRKKLKKFQIIYSRELVKNKKVEDMSLEVFASSARAAGELPMVMDFTKTVRESTKAMAATEGFNTYNIFSRIKEIA